MRDDMIIPIVMGVVAFTIAALFLLALGGCTDGERVAIYDKWNTTVKYRHYGPIDDPRWPEAAWIEQKRKECKAGEDAEFEVVGKFAVVCRKYWTTTVDNLGCHPSICHKPKRD